MTGANAKAETALKAQLGGTFNDEAFAKYEIAADRAKRVASDRTAFKAQLGADYKPAAFRQYERAIDKASTQHGQMTRNVDENNKTLGFAASLNYRVRRQRWQKRVDVVGRGESWPSQVLRRPRSGRLLSGEPDRAPRGERGNRLVANSIVGGAVSGLANAIVRGRAFGKATS
jgi:hypothetical protein